MSEGPIRQASIAGEQEEQRVAMARGLAFLFGVGATLVLLTLTLPHSDNTNDGIVAVPPALAYVVAATLLVAGSRLPRWSFHVLPAFGAVLVSVCVRYGGDSGDAYALMYVWVTLYAAYFFRPSEIGAEVVVCGVSYAVAQRLRSGVVVPEIHWLMAIGTATAAGALIGALMRRIRAQAADLAAVTDVMGGTSDSDAYAEATCRGLRESAHADAVVLMRAAGAALIPAARSGSERLALELAEGGARRWLAQALEAERPVVIAGTADLPEGHVGPGDRCAGLAQPIMRDGRAVGVLALAWARPRRVVGARARSAARLFAAEASVAMERATRRSRERERQAMEINDNIVQGLALAKYAIAAGQIDQGIRAIDTTLARARDIITAQLDGVSRVRGEVQPGDLVRREPGTLGRQEPGLPGRQEPGLPGRPATEPPA